MKLGLPARVVRLLLLKEGQNLFLMLQDQALVFYDLIESLLVLLDRLPDSAESSLGSGG